MQQFLGAIILWVKRDSSLKKMKPKPSKDSTLKLKGTIEF